MYSLSLFLFFSFSSILPFLICGSVFVLLLPSSHTTQQWESRSFFVKSLQTEGAEIDYIMLSVSRRGNVDPVHGEIVPSLTLSCFISSYQKARLCTFPFFLPQSQICLWSKQMAQIWNGEVVICISLGNLLFIETPEAIFLGNLMSNNGNKVKFDQYILIRLSSLLLNIFQAIFKKNVSFLAHLIAS